MQKRVVGLLKKSPVARKMHVLVNKKATGHG